MPFLPKSTVDETAKFLFSLHPHSQVFPSLSDIAWIVQPVRKWQAYQLNMISSMLILLMVQLRINIESSSIKILFGYI